MSDDLVRIKIITGPNAGKYSHKSMSGVTSHKSDARIYPKERALRIQRWSVYQVELEPVEPEPEPCPKCAELAAALAELQVLYREDEAVMVEDGHSKRIDTTDYAAAGKDALARHDAAKDAEIERLRGALESITQTIDAKNYPFLEMWRRMELASECAKSALKDGKA